MKKTNVIILFRNLNLGGISSLYKSLLLENEKYNNNIEFILVCFFANKIILRELEDLGFKIYILPYRGKLSYFKLGKNLREIIDNEKIDIIHSNTPFDRVFTILHFPRLPHITTFHTSTPFEKSNNFLINFVFSFLDKKFIQLARLKIIAVSNYVKLKLVNEQIRAEDIEVIVSGIPNDINMSETSADSKIDFRKNGEIPLLCVGRFHYDKGQYDLIPVFKELLKLNNKYRLYFLGDGHDSYYKSVQKKIIDYDLSDYVIFLGYKSNVDYFFQKCEALLFPSKNEALGLTLLEGLKNKTLIFASPIGGILEVIDDRRTGVFIDFNKPKLAAYGIHQILNNIDQMIYIKEEAGEEFKKSFDIKSSYLKYISTYKKVINKIN
tara:strand:- start:4508 stop:5647 length:1140 start_codon:yes stop_codon:yes gene_type:complete